MSGGHRSIVSSTIALNVVSTYLGVAVDLQSGNTVLENSIIAQNFGTANSFNCFGNFSSAVGRNLIGDNSCETGAGFLIGDPLLLSLATNDRPASRVPNRR